VQSAVGERRAVVEVEQRLAGVLFQKLVVDVLFLPVLEHLGLALGSPARMGKSVFGRLRFQSEAPR
jgi:hypothetical protein